MGNSVIYRPAYDAEVEYLESTGTQWIDTGIVPDSNCGVEVAIITTTETQNIPVFGCETTSTYAYKRYHITPNLGKWYFGNNDVELSCGTYDTTVGTEYIIKYNINGEVAVNNSKLSDISMSNVTDIQSICIAKRGPDARTYVIYGIYKYKYFKIYNGTTLVRDFIPVRIGSTGYMYDKVSKQLFANKGTGNFILGNDVVNAVIPQQRCVLYFGNQRSVGFERIYEEYEWLVGDGTANFNKSITFQSVKWELSNVTKYAALNIFDFFNETYSAFQIVTYPENTPALGIYDSTGHRYLKTDLEDINVIEIKSRTISNSIVINGTDFSNPTLQIKPNFVLNGIVRAGGIKCSSITVDGSIRLTPCKLLQSIPAILDGNGIAREAGECGMWDKVSNRFYGNVSNSGTFTVKGPKCYEEYKWLKVSVSRNVEMAALPVNSPNLYFKHKHISGINYHYFRTTGDGVDYDYYYASDTDRCSIWSMSDMKVIYINQDITEDEIVINCNSSNRYVNGYNIPIYGSTIKHVSIISRNKNGFEGLISSITVDDSVRYVPCKLTHGIPASMDANGIARPAGTCGMWDKVNDKFYGNVESSGTFTVSND